jgi:cyclophilin family peptidyl-prolyl cis-trans isomerase
MASLDYENAPLQTAQFVRIVEGNAGEPQGGGYGRGPAGPAIGRITSVENGQVNAVLDSETQRAMDRPGLPLNPNRTISHDSPGVLGLSGSGSFYLTLRANPSLDGRYTALGRVVAGEGALEGIQAGDEIRRIRILRSGEAAAAFDTSDEAFQRLLAGDR